MAPAFSWESGRDDLVADYVKRAASVESRPKWAQVFGNIGVIAMSQSARDTRGSMEITARDHVRRGVRAAVYRSCWRRLEGDESGAQSMLSCEVPAALAFGNDAGALDDELVRAWLDEDTADFDRAVLISDLVARRAGAVAMPVAVPQARTSEPAPVPLSTRPSRANAGPPAIADLLEGMLAQERRVRAAS